MKLAEAVSLVVVVAGLSACRGKADLPPPEGYDPASTFTGQTGAPPPPVGACPKVTAESLPARKSLLLSAGAGGPAAAPAKVTVTRAELWREFDATCGTGTCHVARPGSAPMPTAKSPGIFTLTELTFNQRPDLGSGGHARIISEDRNLVMPKTDAPLPRKPQDPIRLFGEKLRAWEEAGFTDSFTVQDKEPVGTPRAGDGYALSPQLAVQLSNLGSCLPSAKLEMRADEATALDALFAKATSFEDLPNTLAETDLVSLDSEVLAQRKVYSYAPTYTLFSDHASKMRYVRVPIGTKIKYNADTKDFDIPANTRFYKTFLRKVVDKDGEVGYRKMETRLIVSRPDEKLADGRYQVRSLMVVYAWDKDERMARKVEELTLGGDPWPDRMCPYVEDERETRTQKANPISPDSNKSGKCTYMTAEETQDLTSGKVRHYAIPSKERCVECHMGSNNHSFILGFTPWQVDRRKPGEGGTYEAATQDELGQLQRLIDYGLISGINPGQAKLEESQGERKPRNDHELTAQGYMMGNCAFCHNPNGFPTIQNAVLKDFELFPSATGGVFQFPLEKFSPRAKVGAKQVLRFPYITPALGDFAPDDGKPASASDYQTKVLPTLEAFPTLDFLPPIGDPKDPYAYNDPDQNVEEYDPISGAFNFVGPWRSLIWRNVSTPFTYEEDNTIFIHMPRNVPGFDCRAKRIMAEWMLSIPSIPKLYRPESTDPVTGERISELAQFPSTTRGFTPSGYSGHEQPYAEVKPGDLPYVNASNRDVLPGRGKSYDYDSAVRDATKRLESYRNSLTGQDCPLDQDIIDPLVVAKVSSAPIDQGVLQGARVNPAAQGSLKDQVPDHPHWVPVDNTASRGSWIPRRSDWKAVLVDQSPNVTVTAPVKRVVHELRNFYLSPEREKHATELVPMGLWHKDCRNKPAVAGAATVAQLRSVDQTTGPKDSYFWLSETDDKSNLVLPPDKADWPVHQQSRGQAVFTAICQNCHGRDIDSRSPLASTIIELSGGKTRVANFRDGFFGPVSAPGQFAEFEFSRAGGGGTAADWQARYALFMGLGGTTVDIPRIAINLIGTSPFYGAAPSTGQATDANMLESARILCENVLASAWRLDRFASSKTELKPALVGLGGALPTFVKGTAHYELWASLCGFKNTPIVRVFSTPVEPIGDLDKLNATLFQATNTVYLAKDKEGAWVYPTNHPVGTMKGKIEKGISTTNRLPWCVAAKTPKEREIAVRNFGLVGITNEQDMPFCPATLLTKAFGKSVHQIYHPETALNTGALNDWSLTGAINAGAAAFYYMDGFTKRKLMPQPAFDECSK